MSLNIDNYISDELKPLIDKANSISNNNVVFREMTDKFLLENSEGAAITKYNGNDVILIDPKRVDSYLIAHELNHFILHQNNWPQVDSIVTNNYCQLIANGIDNSLDHFVFLKNLQNCPDFEQHKNKFIKELFSWQHTEINDIPKESNDFCNSTIHNAFLILDGFLFEEKSHIVSKIRPKYPITLDLALKLDDIRHNNGSDIYGCRKSMLEYIKIINGFLNINKVININQFLSVSYPFNKTDLNMSASYSITLNTHRRKLFGTRVEVISINLKKDGSLIGGFGPILPAEVIQLKSAFTMSNLYNFLKISHNLFLKLNQQIKI